MDEASTRYRVSLAMEEDEVWKSSTAVSSSAQINHADALRVYGLVGQPVGVAVQTPDPTGLVRQQLDAHAAAASPVSAASAPATPSVAGSRASGQLSIFFLHRLLSCAFVVSRQSKGKG